MGIDLGRGQEEDRSCKALRGPWAGTPQHLDAPYWQTSEPLVDRMLDLAEVGPGDHLIDLGCGDGRIVIAAARRGAKGLGVDIDPARIAEAEAAARAAGVEDLAHFRREDLFETRLEAASVVTLYLVPHVNRMLAPRLSTELAPGSRVLSHGFPLRQWAPRTREFIDGHELYLWVVD
ncbi:MAG: SAM-dependent methyltransferase [Sphingomonas sp.]|uniref:SAM-dependent methyltransferase n=1 Tax=Sphingomonas sp. TaxID=28214 RepID=UPI003F7D2C71